MRGTGQVRLRNSPLNTLESNGGGGEDAPGDLTVNPVKSDVSDGRRRPDYDDGATKEQQVDDSPRRRDDWPKDFIAEL